MGSVFRQKGRTLWKIKYYRHGRPVVESTGTADKTEAKNLLKSREGAIQHGAPLAPKVDRVRFDEAATDVINDYRAKRRSSLDKLEGLITNHLAPFFGGRRLVAIRTTDITAYVVARQAERLFVQPAYTVTRNGTTYRVPEQRRPLPDGPENGTINRELTALKRIFSVAKKAGKILQTPPIELLPEDNARTGFFDRDAFLAVWAHLPEPLQAVATFAYLTGWRIDSEVLPLEWRQVDFAVGEVRLDAGQTKNREGRVFVMTDDLRALLRELHATHQRRVKAGQIVPWVFVRMIAKGRGGPKDPRRIWSITKAWKAACKAAGLPGRIPHDFRRSAVRNMVRRGVPERVAMKLTGHKTRSVFERYNIVSGEDLTLAATALSGQLPTRPRAQEGTE